MDYDQAATLNGHQARIFDLSFQPQGAEWLASASEDETCRLWARNTNGYELAASLQGHSDAVLHVSWQARSQLLATASADTTVRLWDCPVTGGGAGPGQEQGGEPRPLGSLQGHPEEVYACEFAGDGRGDCMVTASTDSVYLWSLTGCTCLQRSGPAGPAANQAGGEVPERWQAAHIFALGWQPAGRLLAAACSDGAVRFWAAEGASLVPLEGQRIHRAIATGCAFSSDGVYLASVARDGGLCVQDVRTYQCVYQAHLANPASSCCHLPGQHMRWALATQDGSVQLLNIDGSDGWQQNIQSSSPQRELFCLAVAAEGTAIAAAGGVVASPVLAAQQTAASNPATGSKDDGVFDIPEGLLTCSAPRADAQSMTAYIDVWQHPA
ncbi:hypothetical protein WJX72_000364 [[Myrmecia] bisecta]|uniref:Uncharacterized protein n=1 Tax=[Myrmecia] bisecta TaxID=41462 RepID=A0AAW1Q1T2_9CHLO